MAKSKNYRTNTGSNYIPRRSPMRWLVGLGVALVVILIGVGTVSYAGSGSSYSSCTVEDKDRSTSDGKSVYRVYTSCGVFGVEDFLWTGSFDSADRYSSIDIGKTYDFETLGWRVPILSLFPNILSVQES